MKKVLSILIFLLFAATSWATVSIDTNRVQYSCNGSTTTYTYAFQIYEDDDLVVIKSDATSLTETVLVLNTDYTVTGAGDVGGGTVELTAGSTCGSGFELTITRDIEELQSIDLVDGEAFSAETLETGYDKAMLIAQDQGEKIGRAILLKKSSDLSDLEMPDPAANSSLCWNPSGTAIINCATLTTTETLIDGNACFPDYSAADQGALSSESTIKSCVDSITPGSGKIVLRHNSGSATTTYTLSTSETIPANITLEVEPGAIISGAGTLTFAANTSIPLEVFGGVSDGTTICNTAFEKALASLTTNSGTIELTNGDYLINANVYWKSNVSLYIANGASLKLADGSGDPKKMIDSSTYQSTYGLVSNVSIYGDGLGVIDGNIAGQSATDRSHLISGTGTNWNIYGLILKDANVNAGSLGNAIIIDATNGIVDIQNVNIHDCTFENNQRQDIAVVAGENIKITNCTFGNLGVTGIDIEPEGVTGPYGQTRDIIISDNLFRNGGISFFTSITAVMERITIDNNIIHEGAIIGNDVKDLFITNNQLYDTSFTATTGAIRILQNNFSAAGKDNIVISGNLIKGAVEDGTPNSRSGAIELWGYLNDIENVIIHSNVIEDLTATSGAAIYLDKVNKASVIGNIIRDSDTNRGIALNVSEDCIVKDNYVELTPSAFVTLSGLIYLSEADRAHVSDNILEYAGSGTLPYGTIVRYSDDVVWGENNTIYNSGAGSITNKSFWDVNVGLIRNPFERLLSTTVVPLNANGDTVLYTVISGHRCVLTKAVIVAGADAGATTTMSIGAAGAETNFIPANTLSNLDAQYDSVILRPIPNTTPLKIKSYAAGTVIEARVANQSGGAINTVYLWGFTY